MPMSNIAFTIVSTSDRVEWLNELVDSIIKYPKFDGYDICLCFQDYLGNQDNIENKKRYAKIIIEPERMGCNAARINLLRNIKYDYYINLDDDMRMTQFTDYNKAIEKCKEKSTGFVLTDWVNNEYSLKLKSMSIKDVFKENIMTLQGGGMVYSDNIASLIRRLEIRKTMFDDEWPITAYINGYTNYKYFGSLTLHYVASDGGMKSFMKDECPPLACPEYVNYCKLFGNQYMVPMDFSVSKLARELHEKNLK